MGGGDGSFIEMEIDLSRRESGDGVYFVRGG